MADIIHPPIDDLTMRATASLQAMHDRVLAEGDICPITQALMMLIRAIIAYLATPREQAPTTQPIPAPYATTAIHRRIHATRARIIGTRASRPRGQNLRARRSNPTLHPATARRTTTIVSAPHRAHPQKAVPPH